MDNEINPYKLNFLRLLSRGIFAFLPKLFVIIIFLRVILEFNKYRYYFKIECLTHAVHVSTRAGPISGQTLLSMAVFTLSRCRLSNEVGCVTNSLLIQHRQLFFILFLKK